MSTQLIQQINELQKQLNIKIASQYERMLDNELTAKQELILELIRIGVTTSSDIAERVQVSTSAVSQFLNKLEDQGYIKRTINKENRRKIDITLAPKAIAFFEQKIKLTQQINESMYGQLPTEDLHALHSILQKLLQIAND